MSLKSTRIFLWILISSICTDVIANDSRSEELVSVKNQKIDSVAGPNASASFRDKAEEPGATAVLLNQVEKRQVALDEEIKGLQEALELQTRKSETLQNKLEEIGNFKSDLNFAAWAGMLLTVVAIILTVFGLVIAVFSFFGYSKIMSRAEEISAERSENVAERVTLERVHHTTKEELIRMFENEELDDFLTDAAAKVIYRGIEKPNLD